MSVSRGRWATGNQSIALRSRGSVRGGGAQDSPLLEAVQIVRERADVQPAEHPWCFAVMRRSANPRVVRCVVSSDTIQRLILLALGCTVFAPRSDASPAVQDEPKARISAQFLKPDGSPASGAAWTLRGFRSNAEAVLKHGLPEDWENLEGTLDEEGRIDLRFESPQAFQFVFNVRPEGYAGLSWRFFSIKPTEEKLLGTIEVEPECLIKGRLVDPDGNTLSDRAWRIHARAERKRGLSDRNPTQSIISLEPGVNGALDPPHCDVRQR